MGVHADVPSYNCMGARVAISKAPTTSSPTSSKDRVGRACEVCRQRRTKCSGHNPCQRCRSHGLACEYSDKKSERISKQIRLALEQVKDYERLLAYLCPKLEYEDAQIVQNALRKYNAEIEILDDRYNGSEMSVRSVSTITDAGTPDAKQMDSFLHIVSDYVEEDLNQSRRARATGLIGKHSEISWLATLKREVEDKYLHIFQSKDQGRHGREEAFSISSVSYFLDESIISLAEDVNLFERPSKGTAKTLVDEYFRIIHPSFPIISKSAFLYQVEKFYDSASVRPGKNWLGILNLIFALASHHSQCATLSQSAHEGANCLKYFSRARKLCMAENAIFENPSLQQIQVEGLSSFYLLNIGHFNRAWKFCGMALRSSIAMALQMRNEASHLPNTWKSSRYHVWWSLVTLEVTLCVITGRPLSVMKISCTTPLIDPSTYRQYVQIDEHSQSQAATVSPISSENTRSSFTIQNDLSACLADDISEIKATVYFSCYANLLQITGEVIEVLYTTTFITTTEPCEMQVRVTQLHAKTEKWQSDLPESLQCNFERTYTFAFTDCYSVNLALHYHSTKLLIGKPFLDYLRGHGDQISDFHLEKALSCVKAAHAILNLFPNDYDRTWLTEVAPVWAILHFLLQATTVLIIQFSLGCSAPLPFSKVVMEKSARWLSRLSTYDLGARRAKDVCAVLLARLSVIVNDSDGPAFEHSSRTRSVC